MAPDGELEAEALRLTAAISRAHRDGDREAARLISAIAGGMLDVMEAGPPPPVPAHWVRLATIVDESGYCAAAILAGRPETPGTVADSAARQLRGLGADVRTDGSGHPCADPADPLVTRWRAWLTRQAET